MIKKGECCFCGERLNKSVWSQDNLMKSCPSCSSGQPEHIFYDIKERFGSTDERITTNNPRGDQSWCEICRGNNPPPRNGISCSNLRMAPKAHGK